MKRLGDRDSDEGIVSNAIAESRQLRGLEETLATMARKKREGGGGVLEKRGALPHIYLSASEGIRIVPREAEVQSHHERNPG